MNVLFQVQALHPNLSQAILNGYYTSLPFVALRFPLIFIEIGLIKYESKSARFKILKKYYISSNGWRSNRDYYLY